MEERTYTQAELDSRIRSEVQTEKKKYEDSACQMKDVIREYRTRISQQDKIIEFLSAALANFSVGGKKIEF